MTRPPHEAAHHYDRISRAYGLIADPAEEGARECGLDLLHAQAGERVLEVGAGTGRALAALAPLVGPAGLVCGLDASAGMLDLAREHQVGGRVHLQRGDARFLPYRPAAFDAAFMSFTLELFEPSAVGSVLSEVTRVLRPGGRLAVVSLNLPIEPGLAVSAYAWLHRRYPHWIDCRPIDVCGVLNDAGYGIMRAEELSMWGLPVLIAVASPR